MYISWDEKYSTGLEYFDNQHKHMFEMVNELHASVIKGKGKEALGDLFRGLLEYAAFHFADEEKAMLALGFHDYEKHKKEHEELAAQVIAFSRDFEAGLLVLPLEVLGFLSDWLKFHIAGSDHEYGPFLARKKFTTPQNLNVK